MRTWTGRGSEAVFPALGRVRSIGDIQDRIAELARTKRPGEWIVTMPIGDPPYYFNVPDILAEKRWPTRQELDAAAPNNPVYIRSIWGYWRGTLPIVSCANTDALKRAGITRDTVSPIEIGPDRKGCKRRPDGHLRRARDVPDRGADLVPQRGGIYARGSARTPCPRRHAPITASEPPACSKGTASRRKYCASTRKPTGTAR